MFRSFDETTAESSDNKFVQRLTKVPTGKHLPRLDHKFVDTFLSDNNLKPLFNVQESATDEQE